MDYANEEWMKVYTRNTPEWLALSLGARGLALELNRLMGRFADELPLGRGGLKALAPIVAERWSVVRPALEELLVAGVMEHDQERGVIRDPRHLERQRSASSPAQRKRDERAYARAERESASLDASTSLPVPDDDRNPEEEPEPDVTRGHAESRDVTIRREEKRSEESETARAHEASGSAPEPPPSHAREAAGTVELDEDMKTWAFNAGAPEPTRDHLTAFELDAAKFGKVFADRRAAFKSWLLRQKIFDARERERKQGERDRREHIEQARAAPAPFHRPAKRLHTADDTPAAPDVLAALINLRPLERTA